MILTIRGRRYQFDEIIESEDGNGRSTLLCLSGDEAAAVIQFFPLKKARAGHRRRGDR
ncbi:hypothetical protein OCO_15550 [Mycobacterium intracellulare MOTT-02]|nr:hypothetical protein OCO_15550 [Mycobacterium intracellulare MOTT-02]